MSVWIEIKSQDELKSIPNGSRVRYIHDETRFGYEDDDVHIRYIRHELDGTSSTISAEYEGGKPVIGTDDFRTSSYEKVEYLFGSMKIDMHPKKEAIDNRTEDDKKVCEMILG